MKTNSLIITFLTILTAACGDVDRTGNAGADPDSSFGAFAQVLYQELAAEHPAETLPVEIGLFGDLNVMPGENVVMGRYRYRVDTTSGRPSGYLHLAVRPSGRGESLPVVLVLDLTDESWQLREAMTVSSPGAPSTSSFAETLEESLPSWAGDAVLRASTRVR